MADPVGFKPTKLDGLPDFKSGAFDHSATGLLRLHWGRFQWRLRFMVNHKRVERVKGIKYGIEPKCSLQQKLNRTSDWSRPISCVYQK